MSFNLDKITLENDYFRRIIYTTKYQQLVIMSVGKEIPMEIHPGNDQFIKIVCGKCHVKIENEIFELEDGDSVTIPASTNHQVINIIEQPIKLYTIYSPPHHPPNLIEKK